MNSQPLAGSIAIGKLLPVPDWDHSALTEKTAALTATTILTLLAKVP